MESYVKRLLTQPGNAIFIYLFINTIFNLINIIYMSINFTSFKINNYIINFTSFKINNYIILVTLREPKLIIIKKINSKTN
jgi:hypothetical protein